MIRPFFRLGPSRTRDYSGIVRALRNLAAVALALAVVGSGAALGVASSGGSARGDSGQGQYGTKPECNLYASTHLRHHRYAGSWCLKRSSRRHHH